MTARAVPRTSAPDWPAFVPVRLIGPWRLGRPRRLRAVALFADVAGFTTMSEALGRASPHGSEELTALINDVFCPIVDLVHRHGGEVAYFSGDAVMVLFRIVRRPEEAARHAHHCAWEIQQSVGRHGVRTTSAGAFPLAVSIGLGCGSLTSTVVGDPGIRLEHVVAGPAIDASARAQHRAGRGEIVAERAVLQLALGASPAEDFVVLSAPPPPIIAARRRRRRVAGDAGSVAAFLHPTVRAHVAAGRGVLLNEHRTVTAVFCGFPDLDYERAGATEALQRLVADVVRIVEHYDGHLSQVEMGDKGSKLILLFGAPRAHEDDAARAVACALRLRELPGLAGAATGINTGTAFCGLIGSPARRQYTALGDAVNVAARLMQAAGRDGFLVSGVTRRRAGAAWTWESGGRLALRGRGEHVDVFRPAAERTGRAWRPRRSEPLGRRAELATADALLERAQAGDGTLLALTGAAGIGKSCLLDEIATRAAQRGFRVCRGAAHPYGGEVAYAVWRAVMRSLLGDAGDAEELCDRLEMLAAGLGRRAPVIAMLLELPLREQDASAIAQLAPEARAVALADALLNCLRAARRQGPLLLALEDCQWLDAASSELLERVARVLDELGVLVVATERIEHASRLSRLPAVVEVALGDLAPGAMAALVRRRYALRGEPPGQEELDAVVARAGGNPFYAEELVTFVREQAAADASMGALPETLHALITARLDALDDDARAVLKVASVIGRQFRPAWLPAIYPALGSRGQVDRSLAWLVRLDLARPDRSQPDLAYEFKHAVVHETAYGALALATREQLHELTAAFVERTQDQERGDVLNLLAYHYGRSTNVDKQQRYFRRAGDAARQGFAPAAAIGHYRRLLPLLDQRERSDALIDLGEVLQLTGDWREAQTLYRAALATADRTAQPRCHARAQAALGTLLSYAEDFPQAIRWLSEAHRELVKLGEPRETARVLERLAYTHFLQGEYALAASRCEEHRRLARDLGDRAGESTAIETLGLVRWHRGELERARELLEEALALAYRVDHRVGVVHALNDLAGLLLDLGDAVHAAERLRETYALADAIGYRWFAGVAVANTAQLLRARGEIDRALAYWELALGIEMTLDNVAGVVNIANGLAAVLRERGHADEAERLLALNVAVARATDNRRFLCETLLEQARIRRARGRDDEAAVLAGEAVEVARVVSSAEVEREACLLQLEIETRSGAAVSKLEAMLATALDGPARAAVLRALWRLDPRREHDRAAAAALYASIHEATGSAQARSCYAELTGRRIAAPPPLPEVADNLHEPPPSALDVLRRVERALDRIAARLGIAPA